jgi:RimJ/RimL family protein N-acetyltransferase
MTGEAAGGAPELLVGEMVRLRRLRREDLAHVRRWLEDAELRGLIGATAPIGEAEAEAWYEGVVGDPSRVWYVVELPDGRAIGEAGLLRITPEWRTTDLSVILGERSEWRQGYGTEAARLLLELAFGTLGMHRVAVGVVGFHAAALAFWRGLGFREEGVQRDGYFCEGRFHDFVMLSLLEEEWRNRNSESRP